MGQPAARITDMHTCPMLNPGPVPHVGGPILPPAAVTVLIGGLPAARVGDMATCVGPPDVIAKGSATVLIGGMPAARMGDMTAHGGVIVLGFPTVLIGDASSGGGGGAMCVATPSSPDPFSNIPEEEGWWKSWGSETTHTVLDIAGLVPVVGDIAGDGLNALIYTAEGDAVNAAISTAAMVPIAGDAVTAGKLAVKTEKAVAKQLETKALQETEEVAAKNLEKDVVKKPYSDPKKRPAYEEGQVNETWENAKQPDGHVYDPNTGEKLEWDSSKSRMGQWDMGHVPGKEYRKLHQDYMDGKITKEEFLEEYHNPKNYQPESPSANRSHKYEED